MGHDGASLVVRFKPKHGETDGPLFRYRGVGTAEAQAIVAAESPGGYFHRVVIAAHVHGEKIKEGE